MIPIMYMKCVAIGCGNNCVVVVGHEDTVQEEAAEEGWYVREGSASEEGG